LLTGGARLFLAQGVGYPSYATGVRVKVTVRVRIRVGVSGNNAFGQTNFRAIVV